jgi:hypothetical protein
MSEAAVFRMQACGHHGGHRFEVVVLSAFSTHLTSQVVRTWGSNGPCFGLRYGKLILTNSPG